MRILETAKKTPTEISMTLEAGIRLTPIELPTGTKAVTQRSPWWLEL
jgi:hypothetical protein